MQTAVITNAVAPSKNLEKKMLSDFAAAFSTIGFFKKKLFFSYFHHIYDINYIY
jgi:hypothetical protein